MWKTQREQTLSEGNDAAEKDSRKRRTPRDLSRCYLLLLNHSSGLVSLAIYPCLGISLLTTLKTLSWALLWTVGTATRTPSDKEWLFGGSTV
jgi:hypothetical protein